MGMLQRDCWNFSRFYHQKKWLLLHLGSAIGDILYFIEYNVRTSIMRTQISRWFWAKNIFLFFKNNFKRNNHCKFIHHKSYHKPFLSYLPCIVLREYFSIIFNVKKCALYLIKYSKLTGLWSLRIQSLWPTGMKERKLNVWPEVKCPTGS